MLLVLNRVRIIVLGYIMLVTGCNSGMETNTIQHNLRFIHSFGDSDPVGYITRSRSVSSDLQNYLYVADQGLSIIHQYTLDGDYIKSIGRSGKGPGEFSGNMNVYSRGDSILVTDFTNLSVSAFNANGELLNVFNLKHRHATEFQFINDLLITGHTNTFPMDTGYQGDDILYIYDEHGNISHSFGEFLSSEEDVPLIMQKYFTAVSDYQLHLVFMFFPVYQIYGPGGNLIASYQLDELVPNLISENNSGFDTADNFFDTGTAELQGRIGGIFVTGDRIFFPVASDSLLKIEELNFQDHELVHVESYTYPLNDGTRNVIGYLDFFFIEEDNAFYILENEEHEGFVVAKYRIANGQN